MKLANKVAIVTGGANGIGRAIAFGLAREGADIVVADVDVEAGKAVAGKIKELGRKAVSIKVDVSKSDDARRMAETTLGELGKIDILVNNAGGAARERRSLFRDSKEEVWDYVIGINLKGVMNCTRAVINHMIERQRGKIVNIASMSGMIGTPNIADYCASKGGILGFSLALAKEVVGYGINVNCVSPGPTETKAMDTSLDIWEPLKRGTGFNRIAQPEEIAPMVVFLVTDEARFITGQNFPVCGLLNVGGPF